jgi:ketosteroid isomerase-like protein
MPNILHAADAPPFPWTRALPAALMPGVEWRYRRHSRKAYLNERREGPTCGPRTSVSEYGMWQNRRPMIQTVLSVLLAGFSVPTARAHPVSNLMIEIPADSNVQTPTEVARYSPEEQAEIKSIGALLVKQQEDWNRGEIESFMDGYERSKELIFTSRGKVYRGWDAALERYRETYRDREAMGRLEFSNLEITLLGESGAVVLGNWVLTRKNDRPGGVFTLVLRRSTKGWKIIHDHTSSSP